MFGFCMMPFMFMLRNWYINHSKSVRFRKQGSLLPATGNIITMYTNLVFIACMVETFAIGNVSEVSL